MSSLRYPWDIKLVMFPKQCAMVQILREMSRLEIETTVITEQVVTEAQLATPTAFKTSDPSEHQ